MTTRTQILAKAKLALRITTAAFDEEIGDLIDAAFDTLKTRGVLIDRNSVRPMELRAILTYVKLNFGEPEHASRLKASWEEQMAQLMTTTGYTDWEK